jgi:ribose-phosphate pyrophosphokinase
MITANGKPIVSTIFPDGTSQVWKLPESVLNAWEVSVRWQFEDEREIIDLLSLRTLLFANPMTLYMPYMPYARQDKGVSNGKTFNLEMFADLLNSMRLCGVTALDVHNPARTKRLIKRFTNILPMVFHDQVINKVKPDFIVYPDEGAFKRYAHWFPSMSSVCLHKRRDQKTGQIKFDFPQRDTPCGERALILDDLCDGGATFILAARYLRQNDPKREIHLCVTHGIFSKGLEIFEKEKIQVHYKHLVGSKRK